MSGKTPREKQLLAEEVKRHRQARARRKEADLNHGLAADWLRTVPGYRELIRQRVAQAAREAEALSRKIDAQHAERDYLGQEVEGCG